MRRRLLRRLLLVFALLLILGNLQVAFAHDVLQGDQCVVAAGDKIIGNVFALCRNLIVSGEIDGDLFGGGSTITIDGTVDGSLYLVGGQLDVSGKVGKNIHFAGGVLNLKASAQLLDERSDLISITLGTQNDSHIPGSITSISYQLVINGPVSRDVSFWGSALTISSAINGDVTATVGNPASTGVTELGTVVSFLPVQVTLIKPGLIITPLGMVNGQLRYSGSTLGAISPTLPHPVQFTQVTSQPDFTTPQISLTEALREYGAQAVREFVSLVLVGIGGLLVVRRALQAPIYSLRVRPLPSLGIGLLTFIISFPIFLIVVPLFGALLVLIFLLLQLSDLALIGGVITFVLDLGGIGLFYFVAIFVSRVIVCLALGRFFMRLRPSERSERFTVYVSLLIGAAFLSLVATLPYVGLVINALAAFFGLGAVLTMFQHQLEITREINAAPLVAMRSEEARQLPPPAIADKPVGPGMDNLPESFHWWD